MPGRERRRVGVRMRYWLWRGSAVVAAGLELLAGQGARAAATTPDSFTLTWLGHAAFLIQAGEETVLIDPFGSGLGYPVPSVTPDVVVITHEHFDHNDLRGVKGKPLILRGIDPQSGNWQEIYYEGKRIAIRGVPVYHDDQRGKARGKNTVIVLTVGGVHIVHLGDLGHLLTDDQVKAIGRVDVLLIPVGGHFTVDGRTAAAVAEQLRPRVVIPMHYNNGTAAMRSWPITDSKPFVDAIRTKAKVRYDLGPSVKIEAGSLPSETSVWVLRPPNGTGK